MPLSRRTMSHGRTFASGNLATPIGRITVIASDDGVHNVVLADSENPPVLNGDVRSDDRHPLVASALAQLNEYFDGSRTSFDVPLDLEGTEFQVMTWRSLARVPFGDTASYAQQAQSIGRPTATRAVGAANGRNPVAILLPCHRIVGADGSLTGFAGGLDAKRWLLEHEQNVIRHRTQG